MDVTTLHTAVHWTARISALLFAAALLAPLWASLRHRALALFVAFLAAHTIHFGFVVWLGIERDGARMFPGGQSIADAGGWLVVAAIFGLFYALAALSLVYRWMGPRARRPLRIAGNVATVFLAFMFVETYVRLMELSAWFAVPALLIVAGVGVDVVRPLVCRFRPLPRLCRGI